MGSQALIEFERLRCESCFGPLRTENSRRVTREGRSRCLACLWGKPAPRAGPLQASPPAQIANIRPLVAVESFVPLGSGIYFLCDLEEITYVGQSVEVVRRVAQHAGEKSFRSVYCTPVPERGLLPAEAAAILALRPRDNHDQAGRLVVGNSYKTTLRRITPAKLPVVLRLIREVIDAI